MCVCAYVHVCVHVRARVRACVHACMSVCVHVCVCVCGHHTYIHGGGGGGVDGRLHIVQCTNLQRLFRKGHEVACKYILSHSIISTHLVQSPRYLKKSPLKKRRNTESTDVSWQVSNTRF